MNTTEMIEATANEVLNSVEIKDNVLGSKTLTILRRMKLETMEHTYAYKTRFMFNGKEYSIEGEYTIDPSLNYELTPNQQMIKKRKTIFEHISKLILIELLNGCEEIDNIF